MDQRAKRTNSYPILATLDERKRPPSRDGIPLLPHPKHIYSKIGGLTDSDSEYYDSEDELDNLIQYNKEVESNSTKNSKSD